MIDDYIGLDSAEQHALHIGTVLQQFAAYTCLELIWMFCSSGWLADAWTPFGACWQTASSINPQHDAQHSMHTRSYLAEMRAWEQLS